MKPPAVIHVGPWRYDVVCDTNAIARISKREQDDLDGYTDHAALTITVDPDQAAGSVLESLLHETLHTLTYLAGIQFELAAAEEEKLVRRLSPLLLDLLRRNPKLVEYLTAADA